MGLRWKAIVSAASWLSGLPLLMLALQRVEESKDLNGRFLSSREKSSRQGKQLRRYTRIKEAQLSFLLVRREARVIAQCVYHPEETWSWGSWDSGITHSDIIRRAFQSNHQDRWGTESLTQPGCISLQTLSPSPSLRLV